MRSMTGYGRATAALARWEVTVQVYSVNRRTLDLAVKLPDAWLEWEPELIAKVRAAVVRGKVTLSVDTLPAGGAGDMGWDEENVGRMLDRLAAFAAARGVAFVPSAELIWQVANSLRHQQNLPADDAAQAAVMSAVDAALAAFVAMRAQEGATLLADLDRRLDQLEAQTAAIAARAPEVSGLFREALLQRLRTAGLELELADDRVLREIALFADRADISEELVRVRSHLGQLRALFTVEGEVGRKAEFLLQELVREMNTIGSKANDLAITQRVMECKNELERIREQVANVE
jgi:uncharacterized protein (TIGR00255 family)